MAADGAVRFITKIDTNGFNKGINEISSKILSLKNKIENTSSEISRLSQELEEMANTPIKSSVTEKLEKDVENAKSKLSQLYAEADRIGNSKQSDLTDLGLGTKYLDQMLEQDKGWQKVQSQIKVAEDELQKYERELASAKSAESQVTGKDTAEYAEKKRKLQELCGNLNVYKAQLTEAQQKEKATSNQTSKATDTFKVLYKSVHQVNQRLSEFVKRGLSRAGNGLKNIISGIRHTNSQMGILGKTLKRIQQMLVGMIFYKVIRGGIQAISESLGTLAKNSPRVNSQLSALITSLTYFKNSLASAFAPILNVATPILTKFMDTLSAAANKVANFIATLTGQTSYEKAVKVQQDYAKSLDNTAKSTKKVTKENEKSLASFDELNVMQDNSNNSDNSTADTSSGSYFQTIPTVFNDFANRIKKAFSKGNYKAIGQLIADKLNSAMKKIKWNKIRSTAKSWAKNIAEFLNGFVAKLDWFLTGTTIGNGIMTAVDFAYTFLNKVKWGKIGQGIAYFLNGAIDAMNVKKIAKTLSSVVNSIIGMTYGFVTKFRWTKLGINIADFINKWFRSIKWSKAGKTISKTITGVLDTILSALKRIRWAKIGTSIGNFFANIEWREIFKKVASIIGKAFSGTLTALFGAGSKSPLLGMAEAIGGVVLAFKAWKSISSAMDAITKGVESLGVALKGLNASNAIGLVTFAVAGLVTALVSYSHAKFENSDLGKLSQDFEEISQDLQQIQEDIDTTLEQVDETLSNTTSSVAEIDDLQNRLETLLKKGTLSPEEANKLKTVADLLGDRVPGFKKAWDELVKINGEKVKTINGNYDTTIKKLGEVIKKKKEELRVDAIQSITKDIYKEYIEANDDYNEALKAYEDAQKQLENTDKNDPFYFQVSGKAQQATFDANNAKAKLTSLKNKYNSYSASLEVVKGNYSDLAVVQYAYTNGLVTEQEVMKNTGLSADELSNKVYKNVDVLKSAYERGLITFEGVIEETGHSYDELVNILENGTSAQKAAISGSQETIEKSLDAMDENFKTSKDATKKQLKQQVDDWTNTYNELKRQQEKGNKNITDEMINHAAQMKEKSESEYGKAGKAGGKSYDDNFSNEISSKKNQKGIKNSAETTKSTLIDTLLGSDRSGGKAEGKTWGKNFNSGLKSVFSFDRTGKQLKSAFNNFVTAITTGDFSLTADIVGNKGKKKKSNFLEFSVTSAPKIPKLATGAYVPAHYGEFLAILGDNKKEPEVVSPLSSMKQAFLEAISESGLNSRNGDVPVVVTLPDGTPIFNLVGKEDDKYRKRHGHSRFGQR